MYTPVNNRTIDLRSAIYIAQLSLPHTFVTSLLFLLYRDKIARMKLDRCSYMAERNNERYNFQVIVIRI